VFWGIDSFFPAPVLLPTKLAPVASAAATRVIPSGTPYRGLSAHQVCAAPWSRDREGERSMLVHPIAPGSLFQYQV
jgi:hypothetical protein